MSYLTERKIPTREKRLSTISHFNGTLEQLKNESSGSEIKQKIRTFSQINQDEITSAISALASIKHAAVIVHGVQGCAASNIFFNAEGETTVYSTNLQEKDTILGSDAKLHKAISKIVEEVNPKVVFIVGTPVVAINNDDVNSVIFELEDEFNIKIIYIYTDGFKTKSPLSGIDIAAHGILRNIVEKTEDGEKSDFLNIITFSETKKSIEGITKLLDKLNIEYNLLPRFGSVEGLKNAGRAKASVVLSEDEGTYFAQELEENFGVQFIKTESPIGLRGTTSFLRRVAEIFGKEAEAEKIISENEAEIQKLVTDQVLSGKKVFLDGNLSDLPRLATLTGRLGGEVAGLSVKSIDLYNRSFLQRLDSISPLVPVIVGSGQYFEKANALSKIHPDYYISQNGNVGFAADLGILPVSLQNLVLFGYEGLFQIVNAIKNAEIFTSPVTAPDSESDTETSKNLYLSSWLKKSGSWYVKQETK